MRKFILTAILSIVFAANSAMSHATPIYDYDAKSLYESLKIELEESTSVQYDIGNFRRAEVADLDDLKAWGFDLGRKASESWEAIIVFRENDEEEVEHAIVACSNEVFKTDPDELGQMIFIMSIGLLEPLGVSEAECDALLKDFNENPEAGEWGVWSNGKYFKITPFNDGEICGCFISADSSK